jgi:hypothetical protein
MPRPCSICRHPEVAAINAALISGGTYRIIAKQYGTSATTIVRHRPHIARAIEKVKRVAATKLDKAAEKQEAAVAIKEAIEVESVLDRLRAYHRTIQDILKTALESKDHAGALRAVLAGLKQLDLEGRILGEINDDSGAGTGVVVQVVYVNAGHNPGEQKQILDV